jgi:uncharacterized protein YuzE
MKVEVRYDREVDAAYLRFGVGEVRATLNLGDSDARLPFLVDFDDEGRILGIEILEASVRLCADAV